MGRSEMFGEEAEHLREDLRGLPFERMMGVEGVRGSEMLDLDEAVDQEARGLNGEWAVKGEEGEDVGKGTAVGGSNCGMSMREGGWMEGENLPTFMERRRELRGV